MFGLTPPREHAFMRVLALTLASCALVGCVDPAAQFDDFGERLEARNEQDAAQQTVDTVQPGACQPVTPALLAGTYFYGFRSVIAKEMLLLALFELKPRPAAPNGDFEVDVVYQPIAFADGRTPVGRASQSVMKVKADGNYAIDNFAVFTGGDANPALPGIDFDSVISLTGKLCGKDNLPLASLCGTATGNLTSPVTVNVDGSTYAARRISGADYPPAVGSCAETEASE